MKTFPVLVMLAAISAAHAGTTLNFRVNLEFADLAGFAPHGMELDLSNPQTGSGTSTIVFSNFVVNGGAFNASSTLGGLSTGELGDAGTLTVNDATPFSYIFRDFSAAMNSIRFDVTATSDMDFPSRHGFVVHLYDGSNTLDLTDFVLLELHDAMTYADLVTRSGHGVTASVSAVPEPSTYGLLGAGAAAAVVLVRRRRKAAKSA